MASMPTVQARVGYTDLVNMPEDGRGYEIHGGELVVVPSPLPRHQLAVQATFLLLARYGVAEYWIVDPVRKQIEVHALENRAYRQAQTAAADDTVQSVLCPDLKFVAARVFTAP